MYELRPYSTIVDAMCGDHLSRNWNRPFQLGSAMQLTIARKVSRKFLSAAAMLAFGFVSGCSVEKMPMLNPVGHVAKSEYDLLVFSTIIMAAIIVPVIIATLAIAWRYRASAKRADYDPEFDESRAIDLVTIFVPLLTIVTLGSLNWIYTHRLDPYRPLGGDETPYEIQAVSLDYKWLFIYPNEGFATVNEMVAPAGRPVTIRITSDPMMTSLFIPGLISQIYAMPGMETRANFLAAEPAALDGANAMYSGPGFSYQRFKTILMNERDFANWVSNFETEDAGEEAVRREPELDFERYRDLAQLSEGYPRTYFESVDPELFAEVVRQYSPHYSMSALQTTAQYDARFGAQSGEGH